MCASLEHVHGIVLSRSGVHWESFRLTRHSLDAWASVLRREIIPWLGDADTQV